MMLNIRSLFVRTAALMSSINFAMALGSAASAVDWVLSFDALCPSLIWSRSVAIELVAVASDSTVAKRVTTNFLMSTRFTLAQG
jgi:hypothetical protein